ncbi:hypothetical protein EMIHUDRAFT_221341 [Emiliania huxleyi CCMP1516]|uniref:Homeobox domain-containing protein n=2 Tax=Emiliania huxleyi TaxID=2903 RepID=A0A0D3HYZ7_EMIH1|nr:hypothetical protein EMIHUDRAFT_221341 [Emiliania huxleyi CCMP1516]EOD04232.1 hypothetical protein EMIHUDRAFT_221341 [Emiliania huxleyi CCMP1516]|eukprot:XP_005756661.1 hypothetical protein EMIHUDRAFT_221341 [Emiliania huxleyi CCMP1516]
MDSGGPLSTLPEQNTSTSSIGKNGSLGEISKRAGDRSRWVPGKVLLESIFEKETFPPRSVRLKLAAHLGVEARQVQVWFQNRRQKLKRDKQRTSAAAGTTTPPPSDIGAGPAMGEPHDAGGAASFRLGQPGGPGGGADVWQLSRGRTVVSIIKLCEGVLL